VADHSLPTRPEPAWQKMAQSPLDDTTQPVDSERKANHGQMMAENKKFGYKKKTHST